MQNIYNGQKPICVILTWMMKAIINFPKKSKKCLGTSILYIGLSKQKTLNLENPGIDPVHPACEAGALPFELIPRIYTWCVWEKIDC